MLSDKQRADTFTDHLRATFQPNDIVSDYIPITIYLKRLSIKTFSPKEIQWKIDKLNNRKAPGFDLVTTRISKKILKTALDIHVHPNLLL